LQRQSTGDGNFAQILIDIIKNGEYRKKFLGNPHKK